MEPDVVITGMGVVTPAGCTLQRLWDGLMSGRSTAAPLDHFDTGRHAVRFGCRVRGFDDTDVLTPKQARRMDPFARYGLTAAVSAYRDAGSPSPDPGRAAVVVGNAVGGRWTSDQESRNYVERGPQGVNPMMPFMTMPNAVAALIAIHLGWQGPALSIATTCASGADAIGQALRLLRSGSVDVVLAGGCESTLTPVTLAAFGNLNALSTRNDAPERACRPFDVDRDGFVMGEGAGFVLMERQADARARGARPYAAVTGYAATTDAHHIAQPAPDGSGAVAAMSAAIASAGLLPSDIVHVNAHGTATRHNDRIEALALRKVFGPGGPPVTATKGVTGHLMGAAGTVETIATVLALREATVPPTANHEQIEPGMEIDVVHGSPRPITPGPALSNSFGFGGHNSCLVVEPR
ncbi:beta-ketoacyl-[acyl-carrier-protein] synthase family protein [Thermostaphylospora chromogena]|uniref:beta-ketoacyl-[acyl-carrier-protein] synthase family protein n=1 Tax=Thermostaphylospora chromogena TaxID=35622 RepID=UPI001F604323|nr:beta-ketoacyl-[acyl-carrier-protein] synthase family protein [Thermostaphylospora chromogena]